MQTALAATNQRIWALWAPPLAFSDAPEPAFAPGAAHARDLFSTSRSPRGRQQEENPADLVAWLATMRHEATGETMPTPQVRDEVLTLWVAGHTTMLMLDSRVVDLRRL